MAKRARKVGALGGLGGYTSPIMGDDLIAMAAMNAGPQMRAHEPSLRERLGNAIYDTVGGLGGLGGIQNRLREEAQMGMDFIPGLGEAIGGEEAGRSFGAGDYLGGSVGLAASALGAVPVVGDAAAAGVKKGIRAFHGSPHVDAATGSVQSGAMKYPAEMPPLYSDTDFAARGGQVVTTTPDDFLQKVRPLELDEESQDNINSLIEHIQKGGRLDPPVVYVDNGVVVKHDGRHRAYLAKQLGMPELPVVVIDVTGRTAPTEFSGFVPQTNRNR